MRWFVASLASLGGCYAPARAVECTVSCDTPGAPCVDGLTCGDDHLCFATTPCPFPDASPPDARCMPTPSDLDGDCIPDAMDGCIAPAADAAGDFDNDGISNGMDPCPWDQVMMGDVDGDTIPTQCDPFPVDTGDRKRCVMAFSNPGLTQNLWGPRGGDAIWTTTANQIAGDGTGGRASFVAMQSLEGQNATTYDVLLTLHGGGLARFTVWLRSGPLPANDVGCEFDNGGLFIIGAAGSVGVSVGAVSDPAKVRIQATVRPTGAGANLRCVVQVGSNTPGVNSGTASLSAGNVGFSIDQGKVEMTGLVIYDRALPAPSL